MQHPVGARYNPETGRAELTSIVALFTNNTAICGVPARVAGAFLTAGTFVAGVCAWWMVRCAHDGTETTRGARPCTGPRPSSAAGWRWPPPAGLFFTGDIQGKLMFEQQPMKMASAESLCHTETDPDFSVLTVGTHNNCDSVTHVIEVPYVLPFLAEGKFSGVHAARASRTCSARRGQVRPRRLPAQPVRHLLGVPRDDRIAGRPSGCSRWSRCG